MCKYFRFFPYYLRNYKDYQKITSSMQQLLDLKCNRKVVLRRKISIQHSKTNKHSSLRSENRNLVNGVCQYCYFCKITMMNYMTSDNIYIYSLLVCVSKLLLMFYPLLPLRVHCQWENSIRNGKSPV